jgi:hypothetical protein
VSQISATVTNNFQEIVLSGWAGRCAGLLGPWVIIADKYERSIRDRLPTCTSVVRLGYSPKGDGWFVFPTIPFGLLCIAAVVLYVIFHHWAFLIGAGFFYGAWEKRNGIKEGFVLGHESRHDEAFIVKKDFTTA